MNYTKPEVAVLGTGSPCDREYRLLKEHPDHSWITG